MSRTVLRGIFLAIGVLLCGASAQAQQYAAFVMDARTGKAIHRSSADTRLHPASLTKMMTLYIVFDQVRRGNLSLNQKIRISKNAASEPPSKLGLRSGQRIELRYLIRASAVKSANDAATALGEAVSGSEADFARLMTAYAKAMGMNNTTFKNAHGLTATGHLSTARDMATLGRRLVYDFPQYYNLFSRQSTSAGVKTVRNTNRRLLKAYPGADGIKTGYTRAAGFNLVSSARRGNKRVIVAVFGGKSSASRNAEVARLMDLGFKKMPRTARVNPPAPLKTQVAAARPAAKGTVATASTAGVRATPKRASLALASSTRPMPRSVGTAQATSRNRESIAAAVVLANTEISAANPPVASGRNLARLIGRPHPRPGTSMASAGATSPGSASTFAAAPAVPPSRKVADVVPVQLAAAASQGNTGGREWGVQLGAFRAKGDAERQLLTTALRDVPELNGGLRRIEPARISGVTVYRAQFVGLSRANAVSACQALERMESACMPLAPGT